MGGAMVKKEPPATKATHRPKRSCSRLASAGPQQAAGTKMVLAGQYHLAKGEVVTGKGRGWLDGEVMQVTGNFAHLNGLLRTDKQLDAGRLSIRVGMIVSSMVTSSDKQANTFIVVETNNYSRSHTSAHTTRALIYMRCARTGHGNANAGFGDWLDLPTEAASGVARAPSSIKHRPLGCTGDNYCSFVSYCGILQGTGKHYT